MNSVGSLSPKSDGRQGPSSPADAANWGSRQARQPPERGAVSRGVDARSRDHRAISQRREIREGQTGAHRFDDGDGRTLVRGCAGDDFDGGETSREFRVMGEGGPRGCGDVESAPIVWGTAMSMSRRRPHSAWSRSWTRTHLDPGGGTNTWRRRGLGDPNHGPACVGGRAIVCERRSPGPRRNGGSATLRTCRIGAGVYPGSPGTSRSPDACWARWRPWTRLRSPPERLLVDRARTVTG